MKEFSHMLLTNPIYWIFIVTGLLLIIFNKKIYKTIVGKAGEHWVKERLDKLPKDVYFILNDIMIEVDGKTSQIDHIVVSQYGIFVIETKQYNGYFTGSKYDKRWVRHLGKKKVNYENPIRQNYGHIKNLCKLLNIPEDIVFNIVCIPSKAKLNIENDGEITRYYTINQKILTYNKVLISNPTDIYNKIKELNITDESQRRIHKNKARENDLYGDMTCPKCGSKLLVKNGKYGTFIGCSNYPKCKYTKNVENRR